MKLTVDKDLFVDSMLNPVSKLSENLLIKFSDNNVIKTLVASADSTVILSSQIQCNFDVNEDVDCVVIPDCKTFLRLFSGINSSTLNLEIDKNLIKYKDDHNFSFKYYLLDEEYVVNKKSLNEDKLNAISYDTTFSLTKQKFSEIIKFNSIIPDAEKLYFYSQGSKILAKIGDEQKSSSNEIVTEVSSSFEGEPLGYGFPVNIKNILLFSFCSDLIEVSINTQLKIFKFNSNNISYIVSGLVK